MERAASREENDEARRIRDLLVHPKDGATRPKSLAEKAVVVGDGEHVASARELLEYLSVIRGVFTRTDACLQLQNLIDRGLMRLANPTRKSFFHCSAISHQKIEGSKSL